MTTVFTYPFLLERDERVTGWEKVIFKSKIIYYDNDKGKDI